MLDDFYFDFDAWADLALRDPAAFEEARRIVVERVISSGGRDMERLRRLQWRADAERQRAKTPLKACFVLSGMMWEAFADLRGALVRVTDSPGQTRYKPRLVSIETEPMAVQGLASMDSSRRHAGSGKLARVFPFHAVTVVAERG